MADETQKCTAVGVTDANRGKSVDVSKIAVAINAKVASLAGPAVANPVSERLVRLPHQIDEPDHWSPTQTEVDAYLRSLEYEFWQWREHASERSGNEYRGKAPSKGQPSNFSTFFWGLVAITAGCFWWLARIILKALS
jgi:hypothetical protein